MTNLEELKKKVEDLSSYGPRFSKALETAYVRGVKEVTFLPSGRRIYSVVGSQGDEFIDPVKPFCSCSNFFFHVLGKENGLCYHLLSYKIALRTGLLDKTMFNDDEYDEYLGAIVKDVFTVVERS